MKKKPQTAIAYAKTLYMSGLANGAVRTMTDEAIIDCRVRAFADGAAWAKRQASKKRRSSNGGESRG